MVLRLTAPLLERGWEMIAVLPDEPGNAVGRLRAAGIDPIQIPLHRLRASTDPRLQLQLIAGFAREVKKLRSLIRSRNIDVVQVEGLVNPHAAIAARLEGVPVIWRILDTRPPMIVRRVMMPLVRVLSDVIMSTGVAVAQEHPGAVSFGSRLIPFFTPVDTALSKPDADQRRRARELLQISESAPLIGTVANITPMKGLEYFVQAAQQLRQSVPDAHFAIFGAPMESQSSYGKKIHRMAAELGLTQSGRLIIRDPGDAVSLYLQALDLFVLTSVPRSEGVPTTVLEAMSSGLPVVATRVASVPEVVQDGLTGTLVPPLDPTAIAHASQRIMLDESLRRRMGERARQEAVSQFDVQISADTHARAYEMAARRRPRRHRAKP